MHRYRIDYIGFVKYDDTKQFRKCTNWLLTFPSSCLASKLATSICDMSD